MVHAALAEFLPSVQDHFGIRLGVKSITTGGEITPDLLEIVDLAVENERNRTILVRHGLMAARQIDNAKPIESEPHVAVEVKTGIVGTPVVGNRPHAFNGRPRDHPIRIKI
jgi:hypothetical protein